MRGTGDSAATDTDDRSPIRDRKRVGIRTVTQLDVAPTLGADDG
ncbi:hypothetical protein GCM10009582_06990 [Arthrobacter flavus]